jgi:hypothetical protein
MAHCNNLQATQIADSERRQENHLNDGPEDISELGSNVEYFPKQRFQNENKKLR